MNTEWKNTMIYAGFWTRFVAYFIDGLIITILILAIVYPLIKLSPPSSDDAVQALCYLVGFIATWLYMTTMESSEKQATFGKQLMKLKVIDANFEKISFAKANARFFSKFLSLITLYIGYIMCAFTNKKQALHDIVAKTYVVQMVTLIK